MSPHNPCKVFQVDFHWLLKESSYCISVGYLRINGLQPWSVLQRAVGVPMCGGGLLPDPWFPNLSNLAFKVVRELASAKTFPWCSTLARPATSCSKIMSSS